MSRIDVAVTSTQKEVIVIVPQRALEVIRFRLARDGQWLDPSTFRRMFDVVNKDPNPTVKNFAP